MKHLLSSTAFIVLNKELARNIGLKEAVLLADLISKEEYFIKNGECVDGWFYNTESNILRDTTLSPRQQRKCLKALKNIQIIDVKRMGIPAKKYFKINAQLVMHFVNNLTDNNSTTFNNNKTIKNKNNYFNKPQIFEIKNYCLDRGNSVDAEAFYDFYESKGWKVGKTKMKCWKSAVRTWERRENKKPKTMGKLHSQINEWKEAKKLL